MKKTLIALAVMAASGQQVAQAAFRVEGEAPSPRPATVLVAPAPVQAPVPQALPPAVDTSRVALERENAALRARLLEAQQEIAALKGVDTKPVAVDRGAVTVNFEPAALRFKRSADRDRALIARAMTATVIHVTGYTDSVGGAEVNERVAQLRAEAVKNYLVRNGVPEHKIKVTGRSGVYAASNQSAAGRAANRRAVVTFG